MADYTELLTAVEDVAGVYRVAEWIEDDYTGERVLFTRSDEPLLDQLRAAIVSSLGAGGGSSKAARERTPIDVGAFTLYEDIDGRVRSWLSELGVRGVTRSGRGKTVRQGLQSWLVVFQQHPSREQANVDDYARVVRGWRGSILNLLDPPHMREVEQKCPRCLVEWIPGEDGYSRAVWITYRDSLSDAKAHCRACGATWESLPAMREIGIRVDAGPEYTTESKVA